MNTFTYTLTHSAKYADVHTNEHIRKYLPKHRPV